MITPTPGRIVWYYPGAGDKMMRLGTDPLAAMIAGVHSDTLVNLAVFGADGSNYCCEKILLLQDGGPPAQVGEAYCEWMPYQKGQAAKTEALQAAQLVMQPAPSIVPAQVEPPAPAPAAAQPEPVAAAPIAAAAAPAPQVDASGVQQSPNSPG
jgi:hypothetical protein